MENKLRANWRNFINEELNSDKHTVYEIIAKIKIHKQKAFDKTETWTELRSIQGITIVSVIASQSFEDVSYYHETVKLKFCCLPLIRLSPHAFVKNVLTPAINKITGVSLIRYHGRIQQI